MVNFYRAALTAGRSSEEKAVHLSVRLSVKCVHCGKTEERSVQIFIPYERSFSLVLRGRMVGGGRTL